MKTILVVCSANVCRSPMAAALLRDRIARLGLEAGAQVLSAGVWAEAGHRASANAIAALRGRGIDLADHRSQPVTRALLCQADMVLVMEEAHRRSIFHTTPEHLGKVFLLAEMAGRHHDIADPFGGSFEEYAKTVDELSELLDIGLPKILKRLGVAATDTSAA